MFKYKNKFINLETLGSIDTITQKNKVIAINYQDVKKALSCLIGWLVLDVVYQTNEAYLIIKKIK